MKNLRLKEMTKLYPVGETTWTIPITLADKLDTANLHNHSTSDATRVPSSSVSASSTNNASGSTTCKHNVFLSHAGEDKAFVRLLHNDLKRRQHSPFLDADPISLPEGCDFPSTIFTAIETCQVVLVILSQNFVIKKWPMLELVAAWKRCCNNNKDQSSTSCTVIPVFYKLKVGEINKENLNFLYRIWTHIPGLNRNDCREALQQLKRFNGIPKGGEDDYVFSKTVADKICNQVTPIKLWANDAMEMRKEWCEELDCCMRLENDRTCMFVGMWGSPGAGKTWIAMALCRHLYGSYNGWVCLLDLSKKNDKVTLASALYEELHGRKLERANDVENVVETKLGESLKDIKRLFLVLDNPILTEQGQRIVQFVLDICLSNCQKCIVMITAPEEKFVKSLLVKKYGTDPMVTVKIKKVPFLTQDAAAKVLYKTACPNKKTWDSLQLQEQNAVLAVCNKYLQDMEYNPRQTQLLGNCIRSRPSNSSEAVTEWPKLQFDLSMLMKEQFQSMTANHLQAFCLDAALYDEAIQTTLNAICKWLGIIYGCEPDTVLTKLEEIRSTGQFLNWDDDGEDEDDDDGDDPEIDTDTKFAKFAMEQVLEDPDKWGWFFYNEIAQEEELAARADSKVDKNKNNHFVVPRPKDVKMIEKIALVGGQFRDVGEVLNLTRCSKAIALVLSRCEKVQCLDVQWNKNIRVLEVDQCWSLRAIEGLEDLTQLVCLRIVDCPKLALAHMQFRKLSRLQKLEIWDTAITEAPDLQGFSKLQELILSANEGLRCLPECWSGFPCLTKIDFSFNNNILELPDLSPLASSLRRLDISYCEKLKSLTCIPSLTALQTLDMFECPAIEVSDTLRSFVESLPEFWGEFPTGAHHGEGDEGDDEHGEADNDDDGNPPPCTWPWRGNTRGCFAKGCCCSNPMVDHP